MNEYFFKHTLKLYGKEIIINNNTKTIAKFKEIEENNKLYGKDYKYMLVTHGKINQGDVINALNETWLVVNNGENYNGIYDKCVIARANIIKIFIDDKLHEIPCIIETSSQNMEDGKYISLPVGSIKLTIPMNKFTKNITYNNRFIKMDNVWEIIGFTSENKGLKYLYCQKTTFTDNDDKENEIANAKDHIHTYNLNIINKSPILITMGDDPISIEVECTDNNKKVNNPTLIYSIDNEDIAKVEDNKIIALKNGTCKLTIKYQDIEKSIDVHIIEQQTNHFTIEIEGRTKLGWGRTATYKVILKNNGKEYKDKVEFELVGKDTNKPTKLAKIKNIDEDNCTCEIEANHNQNNGSILLKAKTSNGETVEKIIRVMSVWIADMDD